MSDGSKVVSVSFEPVRNDVREAGERVHTLIAKEAGKEISIHKAANATNITTSNPLNNRKSR
jgi:hypothetical protein